MKPFSLVLALLLTSVATAEDPPTIGAPPPPLQVEEWVRGEAITLAPEGDGFVFLVEFAASWCPPCLLQLPRRAELQARHLDAGLRCVTITEEAPATLRALLDPWPGELGLTIASDASGITTDRWLDPLSIDSLPYAFLVDREGRLVWRGDPREELEEVVEAVLEGTWDLERARRMHGAHATRIRELVREVETASGASDVDAMLTAAGEALELDLAPPDRALRVQLLNGVAWDLVVHEDRDDAGLAAALEFSRLALEEGGEDALVLDTHARALFDSGEVEAAVAVERRALAALMNTGPAQQFADSFAEALAKYEAALPQPPVPVAEAVAPSRGTLVDPVPREAAIADLHALREILRTRYAGYDDIEWKLLVEESSWEERTVRFADRLATKDAWPLAELDVVMREYLAFVQDSHFWLETPGQGRRYLVRGFVPEFTDVRVARVAAGFEVIESEAGDPKLIGARLVDVPIVRIELATPDDPRLFPTVPHDPEREEFLLGRLRRDAAETALEVSFTLPDGARREAALPLHRGRAKWDGRLPFSDQPDRRAWSLDLPPDAPWPTLGVRTMVARELGEGLGDTADELRGQDALILDLRGNHGGSDDAAHEWCGRLSPQTFDNCPWANLDDGFAEGAARWSCGRTSRWSWSGGATESFAGRLFLLIDRDVASSGETFVRFASQIPGTVILGENSMGCVTYGNCSIVESLPHSGITVRFGYSKFVENTVMPVREGVGFFPHYWLDESDAYLPISRLLGE